MRTKRTTFGVSVTTTVEEVHPATLVVAEELRAHPVAPGESLEIEISGRWSSLDGLRQRVRQALALATCDRTPDE